MKILPVRFLWTEMNVVNDDGTHSRVRCMVPDPIYRGVAHKQYTLGDRYPLSIVEVRSRASHDHYHACIQEAFLNLPENISARFPSPDHLRRWVLIETGWYDEKEFEFDNEKDARRLGTFIRTEDDYARINIAKVADKKFKVIVRRAKSQSYAAMEKKAFTDSKQAVLDYLETMIDVSRGTLKKQAGRSA